MISLKLSSGGRNPLDCRAECALVAVAVREHFLRFRNSENVEVRPDRISDRNIVVELN